jgi:hypothetical protein
MSTQLPAKPFRYFKTSPESAHGGYARRLPFVALVFWVWAASIHVVHHSRWPVTAFHPFQS